MWAKQHTQCGRVCVEFAHGGHPLERIKELHAIVVQRSEREDVWVGLRCGGQRISFKHVRQSLLCEMPDAKTNR